MPSLLNGQNRQILNMIKEISSFARKRQTKIYLVGGIVRDMILKRKNLDIDIIVDGDSIAFARMAAKKWKTKVQTFKKFQTASLKCRNGVCVDFAMARKESYQHSGALPDVQRGNIADDLFRRDFTINAMAISLNERDFGQLIDYYGGYHDLKKKRIRILHDKSFIDDPTRILRAVRFEQRFCFKLERKTRRLLKLALSRNRVRNVKPARYFTEFRKILSEKCPKRSLMRLSRLKALNFMKNSFQLNVQALKVLERNIGKLKDRKELFLERVSFIYLIGLWENSSHSLILRWCKEFQLTRSEREGLLAAQKSKAVLKILNNDKLKNDEIYNILHPLPHNFIDYLLLRTEKRTVKKNIEKYENHLKEIKVILSGDEMKNLGIRAGKNIGMVLKKLHKEKLNGHIKSKRDELRLAKHMVGQLA